MQKHFYLFLKSRNFVFITNLIFVLIVVAFFVALLITNIKGSTLKLGLGWNISLSAFFSLIAFLKIKELEIKKKDLDLVTAGAIIFAICFLIAIFR